MQSLKKVTLGDFKPDLTLYLDLDPRLGLERARGRGELDRIEKNDISFFERSRARYLELANEDDSIIIIDASDNIQQVQASITTELVEWLNR